MRFPRASAVVTALSTFIAVATIATVVSQLTPVDHVGAILPDGPITTIGESDSGPDGVTTQDPSDPVEETAGTESGTDPIGSEPEPGAVIAVEPAPAQTVAPDAESPAPAPPPSAGTSGNNGNTPGQPTSPGNSGNAPGQNK